MKGSLGFQSLDTELQSHPLKVIGTVPEWLEGTLLRNGPGKFEVGSQKYRHWFDGLGMLHKFSLKEGKVWYTNRYLQSKSYTKAMESGKISISEFATDPCRSIFQRFFSIFSPEFTDNANVNVAKIADRYVAMTETPMPVEFDLETLETLETVPFSDAISGNVSTAHPHYDASTGEAFNYITQFARNSRYHIYKMLPGTTERTLIASVPVSEPGYMHSFGITENYIILAEFPFVVNPLKLLLRGKPFAQNFQWKPERGTRFLIIDRKDGNSVREMKTEAFFAFHHINAFEKNGEIIVDIAAFADAEIIDLLYLDKIKQDRAAPMSLGKLRRYRLDLNTGACRWEQLSNESIELPRINYSRCNARDYRYAYAISSYQDFSDQLVKVDVQSKTAATWRNESCYPGEPVFIAAPSARNEDDGVVLSVVLDADKGHSFLLVLDAADFTEIARAEVPHHIPFGFHGLFTSEVRGIGAARL